MFAISKLNSLKTHRHLQIKSDKIPRSPNLAFIERNKRLEKSPVTPRGRECGDTPLGAGSQEDPKGKANFINFFEKYLNYKGTRMEDCSKNFNSNRRCECGLRTYLESHKLYKRCTSFG